MYDIWKQQPIYSSYGIHTPAEQLTQTKCTKDDRQSMQQRWKRHLDYLSVLVSHDNSIKYNDTESFS